MKIVFLDRDGVINYDPGDKLYVTRVKDFHFIPKAKTAIAKLTKAGYKVFVISNQAGIGKGLFSEHDLNKITDYMLKALRHSNGKIVKAYYCLHRKEDNCSCRKPKTGLLEKAAKKFHLNLKESFFVGDTLRDMKTAKSAGARAILVLSGKERLSNRKNWDIIPDFVFRDLDSAVEYILSQGIK